MVASNSFARLMWIRISISTPLHRDIYITVCYFPPVSSQFAIEKEFGQGFEHSTGPPPNKELRTNCLLDDRRARIPLPKLLC